MDLASQVLFLLIVVGIVLSSEEPSQFTNQEVEPTETTFPSDISDRSYHLHIEDPRLKGFWKKKMIWRPRWIKTWQEKKIYVSVWKKMWGPLLLKEWVPVPKPPPGWVKQNNPAVLIKQVSH